jgi:hypothetical protein
MWKNEIQRSVAMSEAKVGMDYTLCEHAYSLVHK